MARVGALLGLTMVLVSAAACGGGDGAADGAAAVDAGPTSNATAVTTGAAATSTTAASTAPSRAAREEAMIDIGGRELRLVCSGAGTPTVVLDHGLGGSSANWLAVIDRAAAAADTRVCAYDRAGRGKSDRVHGTRTGKDLADDLHALIAAADLGPPVVLVGHSIAGLHARLLATQHPDDLAALVLVEPSHPDLFQRIAEVLPPPSPDDGPLLGALRELVERGDPTGAPNRERLEVGTTNRQVRAAGSLGALPLAVLSGGSSAQRDADGKIPPDVVADLQELHETLDDELAALSTNSTHVVVPGASHFVQDDEPQAVADAIAAAVETARDGGSIAERLPPG